jgi:chromosome segregation ATPase
MTDTERSVLMPLSAAARTLGVSVDALRHKIKRGKLSAVRDNTGRLMVRINSDIADAGQTASRLALPSASAPASSASHGEPADSPDDQVEWLRKLVAELRAEHAAELDRQRTDHAAELERMVGQTERERRRADRLEVERDEARLEARQAAQDAAEARGRANALSGQVEVLQLNLADARRPWWHRWRR